MKLVDPIKLFIIAAVIVILSSLIIIYTANTALEEEKNRSSQAFVNRVDLLAKDTSNKIKNNIKLVEITAELQVVKDTHYSDKISESRRGIPDDADMPKRQIAKSILEKHPEFGLVAFSMANGDLYMVEPYASQLNATRLNFADRDWHIGTMEAKNTYVSEVYESTALRKNAIAIRTPVFDENGIIVGLWGGTMNLDFLEKEVRDMILEEGMRVLFYDQHYKVIFDTDYMDLDQEDPLYTIIAESLPNNSQVFVLDDPHLVISQATIEAGTARWTAVVTQSYDSAFPMEKVLWIRTMSMILAMIGIVSFSSYFTYRIFRSNVRLTKQLQQIDTEKEEFSAMITHELKTPLIPITGYSELFLDGSLGNMTVTQKEKMQIIYENSIRLTTLIQDILDARKIELGRLNLDLRSESIKKIVERCVDIFKPIVNNKGIKLIDETQDIIVKCDPDRILQILNNIISNAIKFVPEKQGTISINSRIESGLVVISITDNGIGIPKEKQDGLFKKFYQVDKSMTRKSGGTGLGLAISRGIIESHGGKVWVESEQKKGTTVYFTIPKEDRT